MPDTPETNLLKNHPLAVYGEFARPYPAWCNPSNVTASPLSRSTFSTPFTPCILNVLTFTSEREFP